MRNKITQRILSRIFELTKKYLNLNLNLNLFLYFIFYILKNPASTKQALRTLASMRFYNTYSYFAAVISKNKKSLKIQFILSITGVQYTFTYYIEHWNL